MNKFKIGNSDHLTKLKIFLTYLESASKKKMCHENFLNRKGLKKALLIRNQLRQYVKQMKLSVPTKNQKNGKEDLQIDEFIVENKKEVLLQCLAKGLFLKLAFLNNEGCYTIYVRLVFYVVYE